MKLMILSMLVMASMVASTPVMDKEDFTFNDVANAFSPEGKYRTLYTFLMDIKIRSKAVWLISVLVVIMPGPVYVPQKT